MTTDPDIDLDDEIHADAHPGEPRENQSGPQRWRLKGVVPWALCPNCGEPRVGESYYEWQSRQIACVVCDGVGYLNVPTSVAALKQHEQGSSARVAIYAARRSAGMNPVCPVEMRG